MDMDLLVLRLSLQASKVGDDGRPTAFSICVLEVSLRQSFACAI
jgi:hypothetical protein